MSDKLREDQRLVLWGAIRGIDAHAALKGWTPDAGRALAELSAELRALDAEARPAPQTSIKRKR